MTTIGDDVGKRWMVRLVAVTAPVALVVAGCGGDDGSGVRSTGGNASASGSASGTLGGGSGSGTTADVACEPVGDPADADTTVEVNLAEFTIGPARTQVPAGAIAFVADNLGEEPHELVVVDADTVEELPTTDEGAFDEGAWGQDAIVGEIEAFPAGETCTGVFDLEPGNYVLLCNLVETEGDEPESHFAEGMATTFTVTG